MVRTQVFWGNSVKFILTIALEVIQVRGYEENSALESAADLLVNSDTSIDDLEVFVERRCG